MVFLQKGERIKLREDSHVRRSNHWSASKFAKTCMALALSAIAVPALADVYDATSGGGTIGALSISTGNLVINTGAPLPTMTDGGSINFTGEVEAGEGNGVAVFRFTDVDVTGSTTVSVSGTRPLAIVSSGDLDWSAATGVIGLTDGIGGGGAGGAAGAGGSGAGTGGAGGSGNAAGGAATAMALPMLLKVTAIEPTPTMSVVNLVG